MLDQTTTIQPQTDTLKQSAITLGLSYYEDLSSFSFIKQKKQLLTHEFAQKYGVLPLAIRSNHYVVVFSSPFSIDICKEIAFILKMPITQVIAPKSVIEEAISTVYNSKQTYEDITDIQIDVTDETTLSLDEKEYDLLSQTKSSSVVTLINNILINALQSGASDIHFDPIDTLLIVRFRIDGVLFQKYELPKSVESQIITRLKVQAELDIAETRFPQDGRIKLKMGTNEIDFRLSTIPIVHGERLVLRIHDSSKAVLGLNKLDLKPELLKSLRKDVSQKQGIILITGPTGSGKTTTLISALSEIAGKDLNIMTIEDPVEYKLKNMAQMNVNHKRKLTFSCGLKHILRQDPDVIMVGEIRDKETVDIAIEASLTGHLVLSTLHTNDAPSTIVRLIEMGIEPYLISSSLISICSQRLIRKTCIKCRGEEPTIKTCNYCSGSGYKGRRGVYEYLKITPEIQKLILERADSNQIKLLAQSQGMNTLYEDGLSYVENRETTIEELQRVTKSSKEH